MLRFAWSSALWLMILIPLIIGIESTFTAGVHLNGCFACLLWICGAMVGFVLFRLTNIANPAGFLPILLHEISHVIFAILNLARVKGLHASEGQGGSVLYASASLAARVMITLAPYFFSPIYLIILLKPLMKPQINQWLGLVLGLALGLHMAVLLRRPTLFQPDLRIVTPIISMTLIVLCNLSIIFLMFSALRHPGLTGIARLYLRCWRML